MLGTGPSERFVEARRGVILTTGGFIWNDEMLREHAPQLLRCQHRVGTASDDGSGIRMGMAAGGAALGLDREACRRFAETRSWRRATAESPRPSTMKTSGWPSRRSSAARFAI